MEPEGIGALNLRAYQPIRTVNYHLVSTPETCTRAEEEEGEIADPDEAVRQQVERKVACV